MTIIVNLFVFLNPPKEFHAMAVPIDKATLDTLLAKVGKLATDKQTADDATAASGVAHGELQVAQANAVAADAVEVQADAVVSADMADLKEFVAGLTSAA